MGRQNEVTLHDGDTSMPIQEFASELTNKLVDTSALILNEMSDEFLIETTRWLDKQTGILCIFSISEYLLAELNRRKPNLFKLYGYSNISKELFLELYEKVKGDIVLERELLFRRT